MVSECLDGSFPQSFSWRKWTHGGCVFHFFPRALIDGNGHTSTKTCQNHCVCWSCGVFHRHNRQDSTWRSRWEQYDIHLWFKSFQMSLVAKCLDRLQRSALFLCPNPLKNEGFGHSLIKPCSFFAFVFPSLFPYLHCLTRNYRFSDAASFLFHSLTFNYWPLSSLYCWKSLSRKSKIVGDFFTFCGKRRQRPKKKRLGKKTEKVGNWRIRPQSSEKLAVFSVFFSNSFFESLSLFPTLWGNFPRFRFFSKSFGLYVVAPVSQRRQGFSNLYNRAIL